LVTVEFVAILPFFLMFVLLAISVGSYFIARYGATERARSSARAAAVNTTLPTLPTGYSRTIGTCPADGTGYVTATVYKAAGYVITFTPLGGTLHKPLSETVTMKCEPH
jgi:hypothetical protein